MKIYLYQVINGEKQDVLSKILRRILIGISFLYAFCVRSLAFFYEKGIFQKIKLPRPVISIGNITWGGVGKTPFVQMLAEMLLQKGLKPAILMRGYVEKSDRPPEQQLSDEAEFLRTSLGIPVYTGGNRVESAKVALKENRVDVFILDDGFQQWKLRKDLDIVLIDAMKPFGNGQLIPGGILREPLSALSRADVMVLTKTDFANTTTVRNIKQKLRELNPRALVLESIHAAVGVRNLRAAGDSKIEPTAFLARKKVLAFSSIGNPESFHRTLIDLNVDIRDFVKFMDHHEYSADELKDISRRAVAQKVDFIVTTEKDAVKLQSELDIFDHNIPVYVLIIKFQIVQGQDEFIRKISSLL